MSETMEMDEVVREDTEEPPQDEIHDEGDTSREGVKENDKPPTDDGSEGEEEEEVTQGCAIQRSLFHVLSIMYTLLLIAFGLVFPIALQLSGGTYKQNGIHLAVFELYILIVGSGFCAYIIALVRYYGHEAEEEADDGSEDRPPGGDTSSSGQRMTDVTGRCEVYVVNEMPPTPSRQDTRLERRKVLLEAPAIYEVPKGVNVLLRLGLLGFGLVSIFQAGLNLLSFDRSLSMWYCYGSLYIASTVFRIIFIGIQSFVLFKYHRVAFNKHKPLVKLGLLHLVATNICLWIGAIVMASRNLFVNGISSNTTSYEGDTCSDFPNDISTTLSTYIYPAIIQYVLLATAIAYRIYDQSGPFCYYLLLLERRIKRRDMKKNPSLYEIHSKVADCRKANTGLFTGLAALTVIIICICFHMYFLARDEEGTRETRILIYIIVELSANLVLLIVLVPGFWQVSRLYFCGHPRGVIEQNLLVVVLLSSYILLIFVAVAAFTHTGRVSGRLIAASASIEILSVTLQSGFIFDGLRRRALTHYHVTSKPGRSFVTFLLIINIALWLVATFQMEEIQRFPIFLNYYGHTGWAIILSIVSPLAIYFRFHSVVCFSEIWIYGYRRTTKELERLVGKKHALCIHERGETTSFA